jgi:gliding motility-associated-like protein
VATDARGQCLELEVDESLPICSENAGQLEVEVIGTVLRAEWSPAIGLENPFLLNTNILSAIDTTYTLFVKGYNEKNNLLTNGNFNQAYTGFTSNYKANEVTAGGYIIGKSSKELLPDSPNCMGGNQANGEANLFLAHVNPNQTENIYCQEIEIAAQQSYFFKGLMTPLVDNPNLHIDLKVNDIIIASFTMDSTFCAWQEIQFTWESNTATKAKICIDANQSFALDNVGFFELCEVVKSIETEVIPFNIQVADTLELPCGDSLRLNAILNTQGNYFLTEWTSTNGHILAGAQSLRPLINQSGLYKVEVQANIGNQICRANREIRVIDVDKAAPMLASEGDLHCQRNQTVLSAVETTLDPNQFLYEWTSEDGQILSNASLLNITVNKAGTYELKRTDLAGLCPVITDIKVIKTAIEDFSIQTTEPNCSQPFTELNIQNIIGGNPPYQFSINNGQTYQENGFFPSLKGGMYDLEVLDANDCAARKSISIADFDAIQLQLAPRLDINATEDFKMPLISNLSMDLVESIEWFPNKNLTCTDCFQPKLTGQPSAFYRVKVKDKNGCTAEASTKINYLVPNIAYIPSVFSPNRDGRNDLFSVFVNDKMVQKIKQLAIYDRLGNLLFSQKDILPEDNAAGWDGQFNGQDVAIDVYIYLVEIEKHNGEIEVFKGALNLVR